MKPGTSLYLDLVRFGAAMVVFLEHVRLRTRNTFAFFWEKHPFSYLYLNISSETAVIVFFVLSGFVIAHVIATRENTAMEYATSRLARLYSVVLPALLLIAATNSLELLRFPHLYDAAYYPHGLPASTADFLASALFVSHFWLWSDLEPPNAGPFWSLSFEATYYVGIALAVFASGYRRWLGLVVLGLVAGPTIVLLAPTWILGYAIYHFSRAWRPVPALAFPLWLGGLLALSACPFLEVHFREHIAFLRLPDRSLGELLAAYAASLSFAVSLIGFNGFAEHMEVILRPFAHTIRVLGASTFALYLFHFPLLTFIFAFSVGAPPLPRAAALVAGPLAIALTLGRACERSKGVYKRWFLTLWDWAADVFDARPTHPTP